jgi:hypothetical protein
MLLTQVVISKSQVVRNNVQGVRNGLQVVINRPLVVIKTNNPNVFNEPVQNVLVWKCRN